jgi:uncharacterized lipoprotein YddW (UPF0748 family)
MLLTVKWCNNGWLDYLLPQSYWARTHPIASYRNVMDWWDKVLKYKNVNLYSGIGLYMADSDVDTYSWQSDFNEFKKYIFFYFKYIMIHLTNIIKKLL